jgi:hypothetical protein
MWTGNASAGWLSEGLESGGGAKIPVPVAQPAVDSLHSHLSADHPDH